MALESQMKTSSDVEFRVHSFKKSGTPGLEILWVGVTFRKDVRDVMEILEKFHVPIQRF